MPHPSVHCTCYKRVVTLQDLQIKNKIKNLKNLKGVKYFSFHHFHPRLTILNLSSEHDSDPSHFSFLDSDQGSKNRLKLVENSKNILFKKLQICCLLFFIQLEE